MLPSPKTLPEISGAVSPIARFATVVATADAIPD